MLLVKVIFIIKAGEKVGLGHLSRCHVLAVEFEKNYISTEIKILTDSKDRIENFFKSKTYRKYSLYEEFIPPIDTLEGLELNLNLILVKDYYGKDEELEKYVHSCRNYKLIEFDYKFDRYFEADFIINVNPGVSDGDYAGKIKAQTKLLTGLDYSIIDKNLFKVKEKRLTLENEILIAMGGGEMPQKVIEFLDRITDDKLFNYHVYSRDQDLLEVLNLKANVKPIVNLNELETAYKRCKYGICAGGVTSHELAFLGIKMLFFPFVANQIENVRNWSQLGFGIIYSDRRKISNLVSELDQASPSLSIDGLGTKRLITQLLEN